jgi:circadian clock protein KaiC
MDRVRTGVRGLDDMLGDGFIPGSANLIEGAPGTGKSTLGMQFIYTGIVEHGEPGIILTFEEFPQQYYRDAENFGWDFRRLEAEGKLKIFMTSPEVTKADLENVGGMIETLTTTMGARRILVDSVSHFERMTSDPLELRSILFGFINGLKREGLTSLLTKESAALFGEWYRGDSLIGYVVDSYLLLRYVEMESAIRSGSNHDKGIREYEIGPTGLEVTTKFEGREGIMSGTPRQMVDSFVQAFVRK